MSDAIILAAINFFLFTTHSLRFTIYVSLLDKRTLDDVVARLAHARRDIQTQLVK